MKKIWIIVKTISPAIGITSLLLAIYLNFFRPKNPEVSLQILNNSSLIEIKDEYKKLTILYDSINLIRSKKELTIIILRVINTGNIDINLSHFDPNNPFGIRITSGQIIDEPRIINPSDKSLANYPSIVQESSSSFYLKPFLFDHQTSFTIKILVLNDYGASTNIESFGKISGTYPKIFDSDQVNNQNQGVFQALFEGSIWLLMLKIIIFTIIGIGIGIVLGIIFSYIKSFLFPEPIHKSPGQNVWEQMQTPEYQIVLNIRRRIFEAGLKEIGKYDYLLSKYQQQGLSDFYMELRQKKYTEDPEVHLLQKAIENMIEDGLIKDENNKITFCVNAPILIVNKAKEFL